MPLHTRRVLLNTEILDQRLADSGHEFIVTYALTFGNGDRDICEARIPLIGAHFVRRERVKQEAQEAPS